MRQPGRHPSLNRTGMNRTSWQVCSAPAIRVKSQAGTGVPPGIPRTAKTFTGTSRLEHVNRSAHRSEDRFGLEYVEFIFTSAETDGTGYAVAIHEGGSNENTLKFPRRRAA